MSTERTNELNCCVKNECDRLCCCGRLLSRVCHEVFSSPVTTTTSAAQVRVDQTVVSMTLYAFQRGSESESAHTFRDDWPRHVHVRHTAQELARDEIFALKLDAHAAADVQADELGEFAHDRGDSEVRTRPHHT